jgi:hypothetical protein
MYSNIKTPKRNQSISDDVAVAKQNHYIGLPQKASGGETSNK